jgi:hypothetical protein
MRSKENGWWEWRYGWDFLLRGYNNFIVPWISLCERAAAEARPSSSSYTDKQSRKSRFAGTGWHKNRVKNNRKLSDQYPDSPTAKRRVCWAICTENKELLLPSRSGRVSAGSKRLEPSPLLPLVLRQKDALYSPFSTSMQMNSKWPFLGWIYQHWENSWWGGWWRQRTTIGQSSQCCQLAGPVSASNYSTVLHNGATADDLPTIISWLPLQNKSGDKCGNFQGYSDSSTFSFPMAGQCTATTI